jgi:YidC/Oxa1 family membrane protein insertase
MKKLQQKYKGAENRAQLNEEMMKLYKEHKVNPASGCLPMLLQMPAFLILYDVIRGITNTVSKGHVLPNGAKCAAVLCSAPRYIGHNTKMFSAITNATPPGSLKAFDLDFAQKLLSHHSSWYVAIPYFVLVAGSVGLQYLQMSRLNARNPQAAQANPQAAMMQKYMPLIFGLIYLNVAAIINVYFIFSNSIRIITQEVLFRKGVVGGGPRAAGAIGKGTKGTPSKSTSDSRTERQLPQTRSSSKPSRPGSSGGNGSNGQKAGGPGAPPLKPAPKPTGSGSRGGGAAARAARNARATSNGAGSGGAGRGRATPSSPPVESNGADSTDAKQHPRSKSKRERKAR